jgi:tetratricopeptide (TPR) repeat protein
MQFFKRASRIRPLAMLLSLVLGGFSASCKRGQEQVEKPQAEVPAAPKPAQKPPKDSVHAKYAGSQSCKECHAAAYAAWEHSHHGLAERNYLKGTDGEAFALGTSHVTAGEKQTVHLDADGLAKFLTESPQNGSQSHEVVRVIGQDPLRQFLVPAPGDRLQVNSLSYDPHKKEWFDVFGDDGRKPGDWGHWTGQGMNWNSMCAACHNTRVLKNYDIATDGYHTRMAEMSVSCESCHGPMKDHVDWQKGAPLASSQGIKDPTLKPFSRDQMLENCAVCHSRRAEITGDAVPGESFYDHFSLTITDGSDIYYPDGQIRDEDYEYASFLSSKMYHAGVRCVDCHDPHTGKRLMPDNQLCMRCHVGVQNAPAINPLQHSHHAEGSVGNDCTSCHMPVTNYMQRHPRHDHGFTIPDPLLTKQFNVPNACNRCHTDQNADWAIQKTTDWYGEKMKRPTHDRAELIAKARRMEPEAREGLIQLLGTEPIAAWRASACHLLEPWALQPNVISSLIAQLKDTSPLVREAALKSLTAASLQGEPAVRNALRPLLKDDVRSVRVAAAWALADELQADQPAARELSRMLEVQADQPVGRMQLSQYAYLRGDVTTAIGHARKAIQWDPNSAPFHHDLAVLLSAKGDIPGALTSLREAIRLNPKDSDYQYKLGLLLNESGDTAGTIQALEKAVTLDTANGRAWYNLGLAYNSQNQFQKAVQALLQAEKATPSDATIPYARATILARVGQIDAAIQAVQRSLQLNPTGSDALELLQYLKSQKH